MKARDFDIDVVHQDDAERAKRCVDEAFIAGFYPGSQKAKEAEILKYRHARDMALLNNKWESKTREQNR